MNEAMLQTGAGAIRTGTTQRDYAQETEKRVDYIKNLLAKTGAKGIIFGNSGGKDSALVGILARMATENVLGVIMPCQSARNYGIDKDDGMEVARQFDIPSLTVDLTAAKEAMLEALKAGGPMGDMAQANINPRLRMTTLYALGQTMGYLVAGTGNRSEYYMGYSTKWGDGAHDFNPISDLTVTEIYEFLAYLNAPASIIQKAPSAGLFEGQTDEAEMGVTYAAIDSFLLTGHTDEKSEEIIRRAHARSAHKRQPISRYCDMEE